MLLPCFIPQRFTCFNNTDVIWMRSFNPHNFTLLACSDRTFFSDTTLTEISLNELSRRTDNIVGRLTTTDEMCMTLTEKSNNIPWDVI